MRQMAAISGFKSEFQEHSIIESDTTVAAPLSAHKGDSDQPTDHSVDSAAAAVDSGGGGGGGGGGGDVDDGSSGDGTTSDSDSSSDADDKGEHESTSTTPPSVCRAKGS